MQGCIERGKLINILVNYKIWVGRYLCIFKFCTQETSVVKLEFCHDKTLQGKDHNKEPEAEHWLVFRRAKVDMWPE